jgi:RHS repeat-associated protein
LVEKKIAGKQWEFLVYDKLDRVVAMGPTLSPFTDATPSTNGWLIAKYDAMNRKIISGWMTGTLTSAGRKGLQTIYDGLLVYNEQKDVDLTINGVLQRYSNSVHPTNYHPLTINYFDDYNFPHAPTPFPTTVNALGQPMFYNNTTNKPKGLATGSWTRVVETIGLVRAETSWVIYDNKARAIRTRKVNYLGGYTQVEALMDFAGKTLVSEIRHKRISAEPERLIKETFEYTAQDRLRRHTHQITIGNVVGPIELLAFYDYNSMGQMISKRVGGTNSTTPTGLQKIDYTFNVRGWLTAINDVNNLNQAGAPNDMFAYKINYNTVENETGYTGEALYNGNISETYWKTATDNTLRKYGHKYDHLNRLREAIYQKPDAGGANVVCNYYDEKLRYDKNGNITFLYRIGGTDNGNDRPVIDDLNYFYPINSNQLFTVEDNPVQNSSGYADKDTPQDFFYDNYGNLTRDLNKGIGTATTNGITYNHLNLPLTITKGTSIIRFWYNASGQKVRKRVTINGVHTDTDYLDGFQYKNNVLEFFGHAEGFVANNSNILKYVFQYKDQVGNVRVSYAANTSGVATILEENHYYPYGLKHAGYGLNTTDQNAAYKYRYNSREWQNELDINFTSMDFRLYDNALGRFFGIDALSEQNHYLSTYQFGDGNPIVFSDPSGLDSMPGWLQAMWDATPWGTNSTWTNTGGGFTNTRWWSDTYNFDTSIDAGPSSGGGGGGVGGFGGAFSGLTNFSPLGTFVGFNGHVQANVSNGIHEFQYGANGSYADLGHFPFLIDCDGSYVSVEITASRGLNSPGNFGALDALRIAADFTPIGSIWDIAEGINEGNGWKVAMGAGFLILDVATLGGASLAKGVVKNGIKFGLRAGPFFKEVGGITRALGKSKPNSAYTYLSPNSNPISKHFYNEKGLIEFEINYKPHNMGGVHGHFMSVPGSINSGHLPQNHVPFMLIPQKYL